MKLLVALGGNALLCRGQALSADNQLSNIRVAAAQLARVASGNDLVVTHGNGPQVGLLALQSAAYGDGDMYPLDTLGAETDGMIRLPARAGTDEPATGVSGSSHLADPRRGRPARPGFREAEQADRTDVLRGGGQTHGRAAALERRARRQGHAPPRGLPTANAPSRPRPHSLAARTRRPGHRRRWRGIPVALSNDGHSLHGVDAVIDKDACSALLARQLGVDCLVIATDVSAVFLDWGSPQQREIRTIAPQALARHAFAAGSMGPKVQAACAFALATGRRAVIGSLDHIEDMLSGKAGTDVRVDGPDD